MMSDLDRGRRRGGKRRGLKPKEPGMSSMHMGGGRPPIILTKSPLDRYGESSKVGSKPNEPMPTAILRPRDESRTPPSSSPSFTGITMRDSASGGSPSLSTAASASTLPSSSSAPSHPTYQIQQKSGPSVTISTPISESSTLESRLAPPPEMKSSVKLIDENLQWCDSAIEFLQDQTDYFVVGVLGLQGSGKSTILSTLAGTRACEAKSPIFKPQSKELRELGEHCTTGIDIYITCERVILLDVQPVLSASVMDHMMQYEKKYSTEYSSLENAMEMQSLQIAAFLMAVCHSILLVQDWFCDPSLLRFIQTAEMLKPCTPATIHDPTLGLEEHTEYYPHIVFVHNRCQRDDFTPERMRTVQEVYSQIFQKSKLKFRGPIGISQGYLIPCLCPQLVGDPINLFLIPEEDLQEQGDIMNCFPTYKGHPGYASLCQSLCQQVYSLPRHSLTHAIISEKNWFHYAARTWELVKKSNLFMEYNRLLP